MITKTSLGYLVLFAFSFSDQVYGRELWLERDNTPVYLYPRRFGQEQPAVLQKLRDACSGQVCGTLAGQAVTPLLAAQPECSQQDLADAIIDASKQFDVATQANMIAIAQEYRQAEKNTPPDFTTNPPTLRNSVFCQTAPKNSELNGLVQAQDPSNSPNIFFDPATNASVEKGAQPNTFPFGGAAVPAPSATVVIRAESSSASVATISAALTNAGAILIEQTTSAASCPTAITVTVTGTNPAATNTNAVTVTVGGASTTTAIATPLPTSEATPAGADFGSCTLPEIEFGVGFDNRKETSFQPTDKVSFNHGSATDIAIITQFICDQLTNFCKANQAGKTLCGTAQTAAAAATAKTGAQADAFNAVFGITTQFVNVVPVDDQGLPVPGAGSAAGSGAAANTSTVATSTASGAAAPAITTAAASGNTGGIGNFGKCSVPRILFAAGLDGRKETSFAPADKVSFNHGSAQNIGIITQFICNTLTNSCGADQTAKDTCGTATAAAASAAAGTGAQADAFNAAFNIQTNFASVPEIDNQGRVVGGSAAATTTAAAAAATTAVTPVNASSAGSSGNLQTFSGALGGVTAPPVTSLGNGQFQVEGNSTFNNQQSAIARSCDVQNNQCANAANSSGNKNGFNVAACNAQQAQCLAASGN